MVLIAICLEPGGVEMFGKSDTKTRAVQFLEIRPK